MEARNLLLAGWACAPRAVKQACRLGAIAVLGLGFLPSRAAAQATCPGDISVSTTLTPNNPGSIIKPASGQTTCITLMTDGITLNLNGDIIDITSLGDTGVAIDTGQTSNTTIVGNGGIIDTAYSTSAASTTSAITSSGGTNLTITGVILTNEPNSMPCAEAQNEQIWGSGITLSGVTGATISGNTVTCYQTAVSVQNSAITGHGAGSISGNTLQWNIFDMAGTTPQSGVYSAGIVLNYSSGWTVSGNSIFKNGSTDINGQCLAPSSSDLTSCSPALQVINSSSGNKITNNTVNSNFGVGIYAGPNTSGNTFRGNTALYNKVDLWDAAPVRNNSWHHNTCGTWNGTLGSHTC